MIFLSLHLLFVIICCSCWLSFCFICFCFCCCLLLLCSFFFIYLYCIFLWYVFVLICFFYLFLYFSLYKIAFPKQNRHTFSLVNVIQCDMDMCHVWCYQSELAGNDSWHGSGIWYCDRLPICITDIILVSSLHEVVFPESIFTNIVLDGVRKMITEFIKTILLIFFFQWILRRYLTVDMPCLELNFNSKRGLFSNFY